MPWATHTLMIIVMCSANCIGHDLGNSSRYAVTVEGKRIHVVVAGQGIGRFLMSIEASAVCSNQTAHGMFYGVFLPEKAFKPKDILAVLRDLKAT